MRQMKKKIIIAIIVTLFLTAGIAFLISNSALKKKDEKIEQLQLRAADTTCIAFANDLEADSIITQDDLQEIDIKLTNIASGTYKVGEVDSDEDGVFGDLVHYIEFVDENGETQVSELEFNKKDLVGRVVKSNVSKNTLIMDSLLYPKGEEPTIDERIQEFNFLQLPSDLVENDYIDIRIQFPTGEDYSVLIGKKVEKIAGENTVFIKLNEEEIMAMGSAIIEAYIQNGVRLYANKYTDPATQLFNEAIVDYVAKYDYAVKRLIKEKELKELRRIIVEMIGENESGDSLIDEEGFINYVVDELIIKEDGTEIAVGEIIKLPTMIEMVEVENDDGEIEEEEVRYITEEALEMIPENLKEIAKSNVTPITVEDFENEEITAYAGIKKEYVEEIRLAQTELNQDVLNFYKVMRVESREQIIRSYPVKQEVLQVIKNNPNLLDTVIAEFDTTALLNTRVDEYYKLKAEYEAEIDPYVKEEIKQKMEELVNSREESVKENLKTEIEAQRAERISYLESLIEG